MRTEEEVKEKLNELQKTYRIASSDMYNPVLQARIQTLNWVLEDETFKSHDG